MSLEVGSRLGHYDVTALIGEGGMGEVYKGTDTRLGRTVAIKVLPEHVASDPDLKRRFEREARTVAALNHPHICTLYDIGTQDGIDFLVMEYLDGETLAQRLEKGALPLDQALAVAIEIADALDKAHRQGIVHRDLKPGNIMLTQAGAKLLDFGIAARLASAELETMTRSTATLAETGEIAGTLPYMAPEVLRGEAPNARSDLWALGVVLHEMLAGSRPFTGSSIVALTSAIQLDDPPGLPARVTPSVRRIVRRCLAKDVNHRYQGAGEVCVALETARSTSWDGAAASASVPESRRQIRSQHRVARLVAAVSVVMLIVFALVWWMRTPVMETDGVPQVDSIAVLPLANLSADPAEDFFADGMTEALIGDLSKVGSLTVISRTSVMQYRETTRSLPEIAEDLGVDAVVEGSVQRVGDRVRITARLINAADQRSLWTESYERATQDVLTLQSEMARTIAEQVQARLTPEEEARLTGPHPIDPEIHNLYLLGRYSARTTDPESIERGIEYLQEATRRDPMFAMGFAGLAHAYYELDIFGGGGGLGAHAEEVRAAARRALELDSELAEAHLTLATVRNSYDWDFTSAESLSESP